MFTCSLLAFSLERPCDGFPVLEDWNSLAQDLYHGGFESHQGSVEIRFAPDARSGEPISFASVAASKGHTRVSVLLFGLVYTYTKLKSMTTEEQNDFIRPW